MAQTEKGRMRALSTEHRSLWKRLFGREDSVAAQQAPPAPQEDERPGIARRISRKVVPGLPRPGTFKRQQSELRDRLEPAKPSPDERRTLSVDRRRNAVGRESSCVVAAHHPRLSAPELFDGGHTIDTILGSKSSAITTNTDEVNGYVDVYKENLSVDARSVSTEAFDEIILEELEKRWILNLSMHFKDKSRREKFFVTYAEKLTRWRRVTISVDYRNTSPGSLEEELQRTRLQRDKSALIYKAIRESLNDIQFYDTVTNLKLETQNDRLHVHVVEDLSEMIDYPPVRSINHLRCRRFKEEDIVFDSHLSGFVYKVEVDGKVFIKKEIPGPETVDEFLYEINALHQLSNSRSVIQFGGVVLDNHGEYVKGLLISYASQGALIDVIYDGEGRLSWLRREKWARQIVQGLSEIHEAGFVQGDFTLSNIVIDEHDNAKIIDINRRGCPIGWEPPEVAALLASSQRISMYIGVKSDLYQLGMVLYALAMQEDEPENHRPLNISDFPPQIPEYFLDVCYRCLHDDPRHRTSASNLLTHFPEVFEEDFLVDERFDPIVVEARSPGPYPTDMYPNRSNTFGLGNGYFDEYAVTETSEDYPRRGRSPGRPPPLSAPKHVEPFEVTLPPSVAGSDYDDFANAYDIPLPASTIGSDHQEVLQRPPTAHDALTPISEVSPKHELPDPLSNQPKTMSFREDYVSDDLTPTQEEARKTGATTYSDPPPTPPHTVLVGDLAGIGDAHLGSPLEIPVVNLDDDLTTETHNDRNVFDFPATAAATAAH